MWRQSYASWGVLAAVIASLAAAQPPAEPGASNAPAAPAYAPRSNQENKSPPGELAGGNTSAAKRQPGKQPGWPWFGFPGAAPISRSLLLGIPEVLDELGLGETQRRQLAEALRRQQAQLRAAFSNVRFQEFQELSRDQREQRLAELRKKVDDVNKTAEAKIAELLDAKQLKRLDQLRLQREGLPAMNRPEIAGQLELSEQQQEKIRSLLRENRAVFMRPVDPNATEDQRRAAFARMQKQLEKTRAEVLAVLTAAQQAQWTQMKGKPFAFPHPRGFGSPPRGKPPVAPAPPKKAR